MAETETSVHGAIRRGSSGDRPSRADPDRPPPPPPPPPSRRSGSPSDLISALPDAVIHRIFSFLPLEDAVKTSVLSKRWRSTWTSTTDLVFDGEIEGRRPRGTSDFWSIVDAVLNRCTSPTVKRFHVTGLNYGCTDQPKVELWLGFAARRRVEDLRLRLTSGSACFNVQLGIVYCSSWLVRLDVCRCTFSLGSTISWPCLKFLSIEYAGLGDDLLGRIFRGSPVLESLELRNCWGVKNIIVDSTSVKELVYVHPGYSRARKMKIWAPHLLLLRVSGMWHDYDLFRLDDVSSLVEAEIDFEILYGGKWMCCNLLNNLTIDRTCLC